MTTLDDLAVRMIGLKDNVDDQSTEITDLRESIDKLIIGLGKMLQIEARHDAMLKEILAACTAEPEGPSPLVKLLLKLNDAVESQSFVLARIEATLAHRADR